MAKIYITGGSGYVGKQLSQLLLSKGHEVVILSRAERESSEPNLSYLQYNPSKEISQTTFLHDCDVLIHLAGKNISDGIVWTKKIQKELLESRTLFLEHLFNHCQKQNLNFHLISASGVAHYNDGPTGEFTETSETSKTENYLAHVCREWEKAAFRFKDLNCPVSIVRTGIVFGNNSKAERAFKQLAKLPVWALPYKGKQEISWIELNKLCEVYELLLEESHVGIFNATNNSPKALKNLLAEYAGKSKPILNIPASLLNLFLGKKSTLFFQGGKVWPEKLNQLNFFR